MPRALLTFFVLIALLPGIYAPAPWDRVVKNPIEIRVTSKTGSVTFHVERHGDYLSRLGADGRWEPASSGTTPAQFQAFPQDPGLLFVADAGQQLHVEAWRSVGHTKHSSADGSSIVVRAKRPNGPAEVIPASTATSR